MPKHEHHKFWMVWNPQGRQPRHMHLCRQNADTEAKRLAAENPGQEFFVLKAVWGCKTDPPPVTPIKLRNPYDDEIPF